MINVVKGLEDGNCMEISYSSKGICNYLEVDLGDISLLEERGETYRIRMLEDNELSHLISPVRYEINGRVHLKYNTKSSYVLERYFMQKRPDGTLLKNLIRKICETVYEMKQYLLSPQDLVVDSRYMYYEISDNEIKFICIPGYGRDLGKQIKDFLEYVMKIFIHEDMDGIRFLYSCYEISNSDYFELQQLEKLANGELREETSGVPAIEHRLDKDIQNESFSVESKKTNEIKASKRGKKQRKQNEEDEAMHEFVNSKMSVIPLSNARLSSLILNGEQEEIRVGRGKSESDYRVPTTQISRVHAVFTQTKEGVFLRDEGSTNGTFLNYEKLEAGENKQIKIGDVISFANEDFFVSR